MKRRPKTKRSLTQRSELEPSGPCCSSSSGKPNRWVTSGRGGWIRRTRTALGPGARSTSTVVGAAALLVGSLVLQGGGWKGQGRAGRVLLPDGSNKPGQTAGVASSVATRLALRAVVVTV